MRNPLRLLFRRTFPHRYTPLDSRRITLRPPQYSFLHTSRTLRSSHPPSRQSSPHYTFYAIYGRAIFKSLTLAFLTYQVLYWLWLTVETVNIMDAQKAEIRSLESEAKMLDEGRKAHRRD